MLTRLLTTSWAEREMLEPDFGDARLNKRLVSLVDCLAAQPTASIPQACGSWKATKAAYRFMSSQKVNPQAIRDAHYYPLLARLPREERLLVLQDTMDLDLTAHQKTQGLGPIGVGAHQGLKVHSLLVATTEGVPLGILDQQVWARDPQEKGQSQNWRKRPLDEKESRKWLLGLERTHWLLPETVYAVLVADRESDMFPLFAAPRRAETHLLVRAAYDRRIEEEAHTLHAALRGQPTAGDYTLALRARPGVPARQAVMSVRFATVRLLAPSYYKGAYPSVTVQVVEAWEARPPAGVTPLHWILVTTLPVCDFAEARQCVEWYAHRGLIEEYHRTLKSGCRIEALQLETAERMQVALALYSMVAWRLLWLTYQARQRPQAPCSQILQEHEWQALYCTIHQTPNPPLKPPTFREVVRWIAQLGGFLARKGDGEPGVQTLWRGLQRLNDIARTWKLLNAQRTYG